MSYSIQADMEIKEDEDLNEIKASKMPAGSPLSGLVGTAAAGVGRDLGKAMFGGPKAGGKTGMQMARQKRMMQAQARGKSLTQYGAAPQDDGLLRELKRQAQANRALTANPFNSRKSLEDALQRKADQSGKWVSIGGPNYLDEPAEDKTHLNQNAVDACNRALELLDKIENTQCRSNETRELRKQIEIIFYGKQDHMDGEIGDVTVNGEPVEEEQPQRNYDW